MKCKLLMLIGICTVFTISPAKALQFEKLEGTEEAAEIFAMEPDVVSETNSLIEVEQSLSGAKPIATKDINWDAAYKQYECGNIFELGTDSADAILQYLAAECSYSWYLPVECSGCAVEFDFNQSYHPDSAMNAVNEEPRKWSRGGIAILEEMPCLREEFEAAIAANHLDAPNQLGIIVYADWGIRIGLVMTPQRVTHIIPLRQMLPMRYDLEDGGYFAYPASKDPDTVYFQQGKAYSFVETAPVVAKLIPKPPEKKTPGIIFLMVPAILLITGVIIYIRK